MLDSIRNFFRSSMSPPPSADEQETKGDIRLAACALLLELAHADSEFTDDERQHLEAAVRRQFGLDAAQADKLLRLAEEAREEAVDLWQFTNLVADNYSLGQKMVLAEVMWGLVYSDGELSAREDYLMRKVSKLLDLDMPYLSEARKRAESVLDDEAPRID